MNFAAARNTKAEETAVDGGGKNEGRGGRKGSEVSGLL